MVFKDVNEMLAFKRGKAESITPKEYKEERDVLPVNQPDQGAEDTERDSE